MKWGVPPTPRVELPFSIHSNPGCPPFDRDALDSSIFFHETEIVEGRADAWILASIIADARQVRDAGGQSVFVTKDKKDFNKSELLPHLKVVRCKLLLSFADTVSFLHHQP
jgi:hypothetical protein